MKLLARTGVAALACGLLAATVGYAPAAAQATTVGYAPAAAQATTPAEVTVVPADPIPQSPFQTDSLVLAAATGFLHRRVAGAPLLWTRYGDHATTTRPTLDGVPLYYESGDNVLTKDAAGTRTLTNLDTLASRTIGPLPAGSALVGYFGDTMVYLNATTKLSLRRYAADGTFTEIPLSGVPAGVAPVWLAGDAVDGLVQFGVGKYGLLDMATGRVTALPDGIAQPTRVVVTTTRVGFVYPTKVVTYLRSSILDGSAITGDTVTLPQNTDLAEVRLDGADVIIGPGAGPDVAPALRYSPGSTSATPVVASAERSPSAIAQAPDGVLLVGGPGANRWNVLRLTEAGVDTVYDLQPPLLNAGLTLSHGYLRHIQALTRPGEPAVYWPFARPLTAGSDAGPVTGGYPPLANPLTCADVAICARSGANDQFGTVYLGAGSTAGTVNLYDNFPGTTVVTLPTAGGTVVDASPAAIVVDSATQQYVVNVLLGGFPSVRTEPLGGSGIWLRTLWRGTTPGVLTSTDLHARAAGTSVPTGVSCPATQIQATARYVYWSCGAAGPDGVYDLTARKNIALPAAQYLLGDGYVVRHEADGDLTRIDLATGDTATLGSTARGTLADDRGITWTVDKYGGDVAYVDAGNAVHIVDPGVERSAPAAMHYQDYPAAEFGTNTTAAFGTDEWLARPIDSWTGTITEVRTGKVVVTTGGGPLVSMVSFSWNGMLAGKRAPNGKYRYTITGTAGGVSGMLRSGTMNVWCGSPNFRDFNCSGQPSVLALASSPKGEAHWLTANPTSMTDGGAVETWTVGSGASQVTSMTPFGDTNRDYHGDLLVRHGDGSLRIYYGNGYPSLSGFSGARSVVVPGNFNRYNEFISTGDVTGDGIADLIARDSSTGALYRFDGTGAGGFRSPVKLNGGYKGYDRLYGVGDFNGDGRPDILMRLGTDLYGMPVLADGTLGGRWLVGAGYLGYNVIIGAGDVNDDGHNDLITRDANGGLWLIPGTGAGGVGGRVPLGTGYQKYAYLF